MYSIIDPKAKKLDLYQRQYIKAPPKQVFEYLTSPQKLKKWFVSDANIPTKSGQKYYFLWSSGKRCEGNVLNLAPGKLFEIEWSERTIVRFTLKKKNKGTILKVEHFGYGNDEWWADNFIGHCSGWAYFVMNLKSVIEYGNDLRSSFYGHSP